LAVRLTPKAREMKTSWTRFGGAGPPLASDAGMELATWVPAKAKKRKRQVPTNSPRAATVLLRRVAGRVSMGRAWDLLALAEGPLLEFPEAPVAKERKRGRAEDDMVMVVTVRRRLVMIARLFYAGGCDYESLEAKDAKW
jgi:hypothetical protein